ncbi:GDP-mannose mannosyl hydrolase [Alteromonas macleodii]|uniref:GDP-mannose mannosyl hydrolase n=1 Tax=Alteromonas macleodii TaxID=28108 RepID=UPI0009C0F040|nr:GDP-mannose mannosyl hydrolase [Alteromonas macleodii]
MTFLSKQEFTEVIDRTPLVSIDLVVENEKGEMLFGLRTNRPAKGYWFVPGGRILKNETLDDAFSRLTLNELGVEISRKDARLLDIYEHFYDDSVVGENPSTHYVVAGYHLKVHQNSLVLPIGDQHNEYKWCAKAMVKSDTTVHKHSSDYMDAVLSV